MTDEISTTDIQKHQQLTIRPRGEDRRVDVIEVEPEDHNGDVLVEYPDSALNDRDLFGNMREAIDIDNVVETHP
jgi:hypothetical protein